MDVASVSVAIRPRTRWQAIDLGFLMGRAGFWQLWRLWMLSALPVFALLTIFLHGHPTLLSFAAWWLKPLFELPLLYVLSRTTFGETPDATSIRKNFLGAVQHMALPLLTIRRLSLSRSFANPVQMLEGFSGRRRADRLKVLSESVADTCHWLTAACASFEAIIYFGLIGFILFLAPGEPGFGLDSLLSAQSPTFAVALSLLYVVSMSVIAPFYTAAGFSLYLSRRTALEGWDLELNFKRLANRLARLQSGRGIAVACLCITLVAVADPAVADAPGAVQEAISRVSADKVFGEPRTESYWRLKEQPEPAAEQELPPFLQSFLDAAREFFAWLVEAVQSVATILEVLLWASVILLVLILARRLPNWLRWQQPLRRPPGPAATRPRTILGLDVAAESPGADVVRQVERLLERGEPRTALSLLYRTVLWHLVHDHHVDIMESDTERECLARVKTLRPPAEAEFVAQLTRCWCALAYAHRVPDDSSITALCREWDQVYGSPHE